MSLLMFLIASKPDRLGELRGRQVFEALSVFGGFTLSAMNDAGALQVGSGVVFADAGNLGIADTVAELRRQGAIVILDVHFPVFNVDQMLAFQPDATDDDRDAEADEEARRYWSDPDHRAQLFSMLEAAHAVTYCREQWGKDLWRFNANAYLLPDVEDFDSAMQFARQWLILQNDLQPRRARFFRIRLWFTLRMLKPVLSKYFDNEP